MAYVVDYALTYAAAAAAGSPANVPAHEVGDLLVAYCVMNSGAMTISSAGWSALSNNATAGTSNTSSYTYKIAASAAETFTFTTADDYSLVIVCVRDVDTTTPIDASSHLGTATSTSAQSSVAVTTTTADCLVLYFMGVDGIANSALANPGVHHLTSFDNGGTTAATATTNAVAWYIQRATGTTPAPKWTASLAGVAARLTLAIRNKANGIIPAYIDDVSSPATVITPAHHYSTLNNISFTTSLTATAAVKGKTVTGTAGAAQADLGINPFSSGIAIAAATVARTALNGYQISLTGNRNLSTGILMGSHIGATPKMGTFGMGTIGDGGVVVRIGSGASNWCAYQVAAKDAVPTLEVRSVWAIEPGYTTTAYGTPGSAVTTTAVSFIQVLQNSPYFSSHAVLSEVYQVFTMVVAGGTATNPVDSGGLADVGRSFRLPVIQKAGGAGVISYAPIQIGGGDAVNFQIDAGALQFPRRYNAASKEIGFHCSDNKVGISYAGKSGDVIKHTNSVITSLTPYYWSIHANATSAATWDFSGLTLVNALVTLRPVMTFSGMTFSAIQGITTTASSLATCTFADSPEVLAAGATFTGCTFESTTSSVGAVSITGATIADVQAQLNKLVSCSFTNNSAGLVIKYTGSEAGPFNLSLTSGAFSGNTFDIKWSPTTAKTLTVNVSGTANAGTITSTLGSASISNPKTLTIKGIPEGGEVRIRQGSYTINYASGISGGTYVYNYQYVQNKIVRVSAIKPGVVIEPIDTELTTENSTVTLVASPDPSYVVA